MRIEAVDVVPLAIEAGARFGVRVDRSFGRSLPLKHAPLVRRRPPGFRDRVHDLPAYGRETPEAFVVLNFPRSLNPVGFSAVEPLLIGSRRKLAGPPPHGVSWLAEADG